MLKNKISYTNINGALYPILQISRNPNSDVQPIGKYGQMYLIYLKNEYPERYTELRMSGELMPLADKINEDAYEQIKIISTGLMRKQPGTNDTVQKFKQLNQCRAMAEEIMLKEFLYKTR